MSDCVFFLFSFTSLSFYFKLFRQCYLIIDFPKMAKLKLSSDIIKHYHGEREILWHGSIGWAGGETPKNRCGKPFTIVFGKRHAPTLYGDGLGSVYR